MNGRLVGLIGALTALCGCAAEDVDSSGKASNEPTLIGSYATHNGGKLEIFEPEPGQFLIGELTYGEDNLGLQAGPEGEPTNAAPASTLAATYQRIVGGPVPPELVAADARSLTMTGGESAPSNELKMMSVLEDAAVDKAVDPDAAAFRSDFCRRSGRVQNTGSCQSFNYCYTEVTGDSNFVESGLYGAYSVVRVWQNDLIMDVFYNDKNSFSRSLNEGARYRAWKSAGVPTAGEALAAANNPAFKLQTRVRAAEGSGYNIAVLGTRDRKYWNAYDDTAESADRMGCAIKVPANARPGVSGPLVAIPSNW